MKFQPPSSRVVYSGVLAPNNAFIYSLGRDPSIEAFWFWNYKWSITSTAPIDVLVYGYVDVDSELSVLFQKNALSGTGAYNTSSDLSDFDASFKPGHKVCLGTTACSSSDSNMTISTGSRLIFMFDNTRIHSPPSASPTISLVFETNYTFNVGLLLGIIFGTIGGALALVGGIFWIIGCCTGSNPCSCCASCCCCDCCDDFCSCIESVCCGSAIKDCISDTCCSSSRPTSTNFGSQQMEMHGLAALAIEPAPVAQSNISSPLYTSPAAHVPEPVPAPVPGSVFESEQAEAPPTYEEAAGALLSDDDIERFRRLAAAKLAAKGASGKDDDCEVTDA